MASTDLTMRLVGVDNASSSFDRVSAASKRLDGATRSVATSQGRAHSAFTNTRRILTALATSYAAVKVARFGKDSIKAASDLNEALTANKQVFRSNAAEVKRWSKDSAAAFGQSRTEALETTRRFGTLFTSAGVGGPKLVKYSQQLTTLASDIASFNNVPVAQAIEDLSSGLTGQVEPMRKYGVFLSAAALKQEAMRMGIADGTATLTDQQRTLAAYNLVLKQTGVTSDKYAKQSGDFQRTQAGYANQMRILTANWTNFKAAFGKALLPAATNTVQALNRAMPAITKWLGNGDLAKSLEDLGPKVAGMFRGVQGELPAIKSLFSDLGDAARMAGSGLKWVWDAFQSMPDGVKQAIVTIGAAAAALKVLNRASGGGGMTMFGSMVESIPHAIFRSAASVAAAESVKAVFGNRIGTMTITAGVVNVVGKGGVGPGAGKTGGLTSKAGAAGLVSLLGSAAITSAITAAAGYAYYKLVNPEPKRQQQGGNPTTYAGSYGSNRTINPTGNAPLTRTGQAQADRYAARAMAEYAVQAQKAAGAAGTLATRVRLLPAPARQAAIEANKLAAAVAKAADRKFAKVTLQGAKEAARDAVDLANKLKRIQNKDARVTASGARQAARDAVDFAAKLARVPKSKETKVSAPGATAAKSQVDGLRNSVNLLQSKTIDIRTRYTTEGRPGKGALVASGGLMRGPGTSTSDDIPAWLSDGEYVIRAAAVNRYGVDMFHRLNALAFKKGGYAKAPKNPGDKASDKAQRAYNKAVRRYEPTAEAKGAEGAARLNQKLADLMAKRGITDATTRDFLLSMSPRAAIKLLQARGNKKIGSLARKYASLNPPDTDTGGGGGGGPEGPTPEEQQAAALDKVNALRDAVDEAASSYRSFAGIATTALGDVTAAQEKVTTAEEAVTAARRKFDLAGNDRDRADAARELAAAEGNLANAQLERNNTTDKPTAGSIRANMASKLQKLRDFSGLVRRLKDMGLNAVTLSEILGMGPEQGYDFAKALVDGGFGDLNDVQAGITAEAANLGMFTSSTNAGAANLTGAAAAAAAGLTSGGITLTPAPVTLKLDTGVLATALVEWNRQNGR